MKKRIDARMLVLPPYLSTTWKNILSISVKDAKTLSIELLGGKSLEIPNLDLKTVEEIFEAHALYLENENTNVPMPKKDELSFGFPLKIVGGGLDTMGAFMQHNPEQANSPNLPKEVLTKVISVARMLGIDDTETMPKPEPHCNCPYCQIAKAIQISSGVLEENMDEEVSDEELSFRTWDIHQKGDNLYEVINPLDGKELYNVFLGQPIGCTCGKKNCEHIKAVLNS